MRFPPVLCVHERGAWAPAWGPPGSSPDPCLYFHRAAPSYFSPATARPAQLSSRLPEVNFQRQVRTPGEGLLVTGLRAGWEGGTPAQRELAFPIVPDPGSFLQPVWVLPLCRSGQDVYSL